MDSSTTPKRDYGWAGTTPEQRRERMRKVWEASQRNARERRIAKLIEAAPPLTAEQRARLSVLLNAQGAAEAAS